jgi:hypothetical protein
MENGTNCRLIEFLNIESDTYIESDEFKDFCNDIIERESLVIALYWNKKKKKIVSLLMNTKIREIENAINQSENYTVLKEQIFI